MNILSLLFGSLLTDNLFFGKLCGSVCGGKNACVKAAARIGLMTLIVSALSALILSLIDKWVLLPLNAMALHLIAYAAVAMLLTQAMRCVPKEKNPGFEELCLPVFIGSMAVGIAAQGGADVLASLIGAIGAGAGYLIVLVLLTGIRDRLSGSKIPACLKGLPISLITAGLMTLAFMGFVGLA